MDSVSQSKSFINILPDQGNSWPGEILESHSLGIYIKEDRERTSEDSKALGYLQTSPSWKKNYGQFIESSDFREINLGIDPYGLGLWRSDLFKSHLLMDHFKVALDKNVKVFRISTLPFKIAGSSSEQDLAILLASVLQIFRDYEGEVEILDLFKCLSFEIAVGSNLFESLNLLHAFRILIGRLMELYDIDHSLVPSFYTVADVRKLACREPWNNILRLTSMHSASLMGGADGHVSLPFDLFSHNKGQRVSRNITEILRRESHLDKVSNPVEGSFHLEKEVEKLCEKAWSLCGEIEKKEGLKACLRSGWLYTQIYTHQEEQTKKLLLREIKMTGVNQFVLKRSLSKEYPIVDQSESQTLEAWWSQWMDLSEADRLCHVERFVPHSLVGTFEKWQFSGDNWNRKRGEGYEIPVLVESPQVKNRKWGALSEIFGLAALSLKEMSLENIEDSPVVLVLAGDPEGEYVKNLFAKTPEKTHSHFIWGGEKLVEPFSVCLNPHQPLDEFFQFVFKHLEASI